MAIVFVGLLTFFVLHSTSGYTINITHVENCKDVLGGVSQYPVELLTVVYDREKTGIADTIHGTYIVREIDTAGKELLLTIFQCSADSTGQCNDNRKDFVEGLHCDRFHGDSTGPWYMLSSAMSGSHCGEVTGNFTLDYARLRPQYLTNYLTVDDRHSRCRIRMLFHRKGEATENMIVRGCLSIEFNMII